MEVVCLSDAGAFVEAARTAFDREPVATNLIASNAAAVLAGRSTPQDPRWFVARQGAWVVGVAMQTHPYPLWLGPMDAGPMDAGPMDAGTAGTADEAARALLEQYVAHGWTTAGVNGSAVEAAAFARLWEHHAGVQAAVTMQQLMYELVELVAPTGVPGAGRLAAEDDVAMLQGWMRGFSRDVGEGHLVEDLDELVRERVTARNFLVWEVDGRAVSLAGTHHPSAGVARVGPVYTPPQDRRRGFGAAATAAVSQLAFDRGAQRCMLFTDAANPTANAVYQRLGYTLVGEAVRYRFVPAT